MVNIKDAATIIAGRVLSVDDVIAFGGSGEIVGRKVLVHTADGYGIVKLGKDVNFPVYEGAVVVWKVRQAYYEIASDRGSNSGMSCNFVGIVTAADLDQLSSYVQEQEKALSSAASK